MKRELLDLQAHRALAKGDLKEEVPRLIRLYQQRAALYQDQLDAKMRNIMDLKNHIIEDRRLLIELQRELRRAKADLRMALLRYESAKGEVVVAQKSIVNREETIRLLKREIDRLRNLLKINAPLQQRWREIQQAENDTFEGIQRTQADIAKAQRSRTRYADNPTVSLYFDRMLDRSRATLAKLELKRKEFREQRELNQIESLRAMSQIARENELAMPENMVIQLMPRPPPVKNLPRPRPEPANEDDDYHSFTIPEEDAQRYQTASYADTLALLGSLVGKKSPTVLQQMLRNARHSELVLPTKQPARTRQPVALTVKPVKMPR
jgi:hypothetical protein